MRDDIKEALESACVTDLDSSIAGVRFHSLRNVTALVEAFLTGLPDDSMSIRELLAEL